VAEIRLVWFGLLQVQRVVARDLMIFSGLGKNGFAHVDTFLLSVKTNADETAKKYERLFINVSQNCILHPFPVLEAPFCQKKGQNRCTLLYMYISQSIIHCSSRSNLLLTSTVVPKAQKLFHLNNQKCMSIPVLYK